MKAKPIRGSDPVKQAPEVLARQSAQTVSEVARASLDALAEGRGRFSMYDKMAHLCGKYRMPRDASMSLDYLTGKRKRGIMGR